MKSRSITFFCWVAVAAVVAVAGCAPGGNLEPGRAANAIINGVASGPEDDAAVAIGLFSTGGNLMGACSGVLVAPNLVLTAHHCVSRTEEGGIACDDQGNPVAGGGVLG